MEYTKGGVTWLDQPVGIRLHDGSWATSQRYRDLDSGAIRLRFSAWEEMPGLGKRVDLDLTADEAEEFAIAMLTDVLYMRRGGG